MRPHAVLGEINKYDFHTDERYVFKARKGLNRQVVAEISGIKGEPAWMRDFRLESLAIFESKPMPTWGGQIGIDFQNVYYYLKPSEGQSRTWEDVPREIPRRSTSWAFPRPRRSTWPASRPSTRAKWSTGR